MATVAASPRTDSPREVGRVPLTGSFGAIGPSTWDPRDLEIVPSWLHSAPDDSPIKGGDRYPSAESLDRELGPVANLEARCRLIQARLIAQFLSRRAWSPLGFARLRDYSAERLGLAARTLEEDAQIVQALESLPQIKAAFLQRGINWTHVRLLIGVATAQDEATWLEFALSHTTRELDALVKMGAPPAGQPGDTGVRDVGDATQDAASRASGDQIASFDESRCHGDGGTDLASDTSSDTQRPQPDGEDADPMLLWSIHCSREGRRLWRASCEMASRMAGSQLARWQAAELIAAEAMSAAPHVSGATSHAGAGYTGRPLEAAAESWRARSEQYIEAFRAEYGTAEGLACLEPVRQGPELPAELEALLEGIEDADAHELDRRLRIVRAAMQRIDWQLGTILRCVVDHKLHQELGFASFRLYVEARLGISGRKGWALVRLERYSLHRSSELRLAYRRGDISWLAATTLLPVITEKYQHEWIRRAGEVTLQRLAEEVSWALDRADEPRGEQCQPPPPIDLDVRADSASRVDEERTKMRAQTGSPQAPDPLGWGYTVGALVTLRAPVTVLALLEQVIEAYRTPGEQRWRAFERVLAHAFLTWQSQPRHRDPVFERDSWTCQVPACTSRCHLHDHHVSFLSHGGGNELSNRVTTCAAHHLHGIHAGIIRASGRAPEAVVWELGCRGRNQPLLRTLGDRYLDRPVQ